MSDHKKNASQTGLLTVGQELDRLFSWVEARRLADQNLFLLAGLLAILAIASSFPNYHRFEFGNSPFMREAMEWKFAHPLLPIPVQQIAEQFHAEGELGNISHMEKCSYRVLIPLVAHVFGFGTTTALIIQQVLAVLLLLLALAMLRHLFQDTLSALFAAMMLAASFPGQWGFSDFVCFDGYGYFLIAMALWTRSPWVLAATVFAGGLCDERVILVTPLIWLWNSVRSGPNDFSIKNLLWPRATHWGLIAGVLLFGMVRIYLGLKWGTLVETSEIGERFLFIKGLHFLPLTVLTGFKGGVVIFFFSIALLLARRRFALLALAIFAALPALLAAVMVWDLSRSFYYIFPALFLGMAVMANQCSRRECRKIMFCACLGSLVFSTCFIQPFNIRMLNY
jgi:hypothetical protein